MSITQELKVIDRTDGDADRIPGTVIIHDTVSGEASIISYDDEIVENAVLIAGPLPEDYEGVPEDLETAWKSGNDRGKLDGLEAALGVRIEHFEDFLKEHSGEWTTLDGRTIQEDPEWTYPAGLTH